MLEFMGETLVAMTKRLKFGIILYNENHKIKVGQCSNFPTGTYTSRLESSPGLAQIM